jgi:hypothetical protein
MSVLFKDILKIPERSLSQIKITKSFFLKHFELSSAEKNVLNNEIQNMEWLANIKPATSNISAVVNGNYSFDEVQVMICTLKELGLNKYAEKCIQIFQKYIPYQILLIVEDEESYLINSCDKRINQNDVSKRTIEKHMSTPILSKLYKDELIERFFKELEFSILDKTNLETTYKSYIRAIVNYQTSLVAGRIVPSRKTRTEEDIKLLEAIEQKEKEISKLTNQIKKESQFNSRLNLNVDIQKHRKEIESIKNKLGEE